MMRANYAKCVAENTCSLLLFITVQNWRTRDRFGTRSHFFSEPLNRADGRQVSTAYILVVSVHRAGCTAGYTK